MRRVLGSAVVVLVLLLVADRGTDWAAECLLAGELQQSANLGEAPDVDITGFPFLTQLARGRYRPIQVDVRTPIVVDGTRIDRSSAVIHGARLPFQALVNRDVDAVRVRRTSVAAHVPFAQLERLVSERLDGSVVQLRLSRASKGLVRVTGEVSSPIGRVQVRAPVEVGIDAGRLRLVLPAGSLAQMPSVARDIISSVLRRPLELPDPPGSFRVTSADVDGGGVTVYATSTQTRLELLSGR